LGMEVSRPAHGREKKKKEMELKAADERVLGVPRVKSSAIEVRKGKCQIQ